MTAANKLVPVVEGKNYFHEEMFSSGLETSEVLSKKHSKIEKSHFQQLHGRRRVPEKSESVFSFLAACRAENRNREMSEIFKRNHLATSQLLK